MFHLRAASAADLSRVLELETAGFPADEAADEASLQFRIKNANEYFRVACRGDEIVGFVNGTCCNADELDHDSMSEHVPGGSTLCVHGVVVDESMRRSGIATWMMKMYLRQIHETAPGIVKVLLIAKLPLTPLYSGCGFNMVGQSKVVHGKDTWYEMKHMVPRRPRVPLVQVDAFASEAFKGNPAAVMVLSSQYLRAEEHVQDEVWMQAAAMENNLSETAFLRPLSDGSWAIRWFSPEAEVPLCGHGTLASTHALVEGGYIPRCQESIRLVYGGGELRTRVAGGIIHMDFPSASYEEISDPEVKKQLAAAFALPEPLSDSVLFVGRDGVKVMVHTTRAAFDGMTPDIGLLKAFDAQGVVITAEGNDEDGADFVSRFFCPLLGVDEDPVTGSAHCGLTPYWSKRLGKTALVAHQASKRYGVLKVEDKGERVAISGSAVTVLEGAFYGSACPSSGAREGGVHGAGDGSGAGSE